MNEWQPIETAPKGKSIWIGFHNSFNKWRTVKAVHYERHTEEYDGWHGDNDGPFEWADVVDDVAYCPAGWYEDLYSEVDGYTYLQIDVEPTHWQPLPKPPKR